MITCTGIVFGFKDTHGDFIDTGESETCGAPATATVRVTITGADRARCLRPESTPTPWNLDNEPRCASCASMDKRIAVRMFDGATFDAEPFT